MVEKRKPNEASLDALRNIQTATAGAAAMLIGCFMMILYERYLIGALCVLLGAGIFAVLLSVTLRQRRTD